MFKPQKSAIAAAAGLIASACGMSTNANAEENKIAGEFWHEHWLGSAFVSKATNEFQYCLVDAIFEPHIFLGFVYDSEGIALLLITKSWKLKNEEPFPVTLALGSRWRQDTNGYPSKSKKENTWRVEIPIEDKTVALKKFGDSEIFSVVGSGNKFKFRLADISGALEKLEQCYRKYGDAGVAEKNEKKR